MPKNALLRNFTPEDAHRLCSQNEGRCSSCPLTTPSGECKIRQADVSVNLPRFWEFKPQNETIQLMGFTFGEVQKICNEHLYCCDSCPLCNEKGDCCIAEAFGSMPCYPEDWDLEKTWPVKLRIHAKEAGTYLVQFEVEASDKELTVSAYNWIEENLKNVENFDIINEGEIE